jgi:serine/threonine protein kinase
MGVVYEADETGPVRRRVAVKVIRAGYASREVLNRFDAERQALALMDHAGIATVLAAGETRRFPVVFFVDPELPADVKTITLSYTFFEVAGAVKEQAAVTAARSTIVAPTIGRRAGIAGRGRTERRLAP